MASSGLDGFVEQPYPIRDALERNIRYHRNEASPFGNYDNVEIIHGDRLLIDRYYGTAFDFVPPRESAVYGIEDDLPNYSGDDLADLGFLRVPFRRIPRVRIKSRNQLDALVASIRPRESRTQVLFRGQTREYTLGRSADTLQRLYGTHNAIEPALLASAARHSVAVDDVMPQWMAIIQAFAKIGEASPLAVQNRSARYSFMLFAIALAQHYGLPTVGLDVTTSLDVALFFALTEFIPHPSMAGYQLCRRKSTLEPSVIYVLAPYQQYQYDYDDFSLPNFAAPRPERQKARFMHVGWDLQANAAARYIFMALYLDNDADFGPIPDAAQMFPSPAEDEFGAFLQAVRDTLPRNDLKEFLARLYWATDA